MEATPGDWAVLKVQPRREVLAWHAVRAQGVEGYLPVLPHRRNRKSPEFIFPGYLFGRVRTGSDDLLRIRSLPGISYVVPRGGRPALLPDAVVADIRQRLTTLANGSATDHLRRGDRVTVVNGPFRWVDAVFDRRLNSAGRVRILLQMVHGSVPVDIDEQDLEPLSSFRAAAAHSAGV